MTAPVKSESSFGQPRVAWTGPVRLTFDLGRARSKLDGMADLEAA